MEKETQGFLSDVEADQNAGGSSLPVLIEDGAPLNAEYLFKAVNLQVKYSASEKNLGHPYINGRADVLEPEDFEGDSIYFMLWCPAVPADDASKKDMRTAESGQKRFKAQVEAIGGGDSFTGLPGDMEEAMHTLAEILDEQTFVGRLGYESLKKEQKAAGYTARAKIKEFRNAEQYGEEEGA